MNKKLQAAIASYARTAFAAVVAAFLAGNTDTKSLGMIALASVLGPLARAVNKNDPAFGLGSDK